MWTKTSASTTFAYIRNMPSFGRAAAILLTLSALVACAAQDDVGSDDPNVTAAAVQTPPRSWRTHPAIVEVDDADEIFAVSDIHGHYDQAVRILAANHLVDGPNADPKKVKWTGGKAIVVVVGDLIDKGPDSLEVIDLMRNLEDGAKRAGGRVIVLMGNHEAEFLADPRNSKATSNERDAVGIDVALDRLHIEPKSLVKGTDAAGRGAWIANLPLGCRIKKWFFAHGGNTGRRTVADLEDKLEKSVDRHGWDDDDITGNDSILEGQKWYGDPDDDDAGKKEANALGVKHIVFGHDPGALKDHGRIRASKNRVLVKIDTEMGIHDASGIGRAALLHLHTRGEDTAEALDEAGRATPISL